jgi:hypothetical protein
MFTQDYEVYTTDEGDCLSLLPVDHVSKYGLAPEAIMGQVVGDTAGASPTPDTFVANRAFHEFLHGVVARYAPATAEVAASAREQRDGWIYIVDRRTPTPDGRVPPEDVIGGFEVRGGAIVARSYQPIPAHQLMTEHGFFRLGDELQSRLVAELEQLRTG